MITSHIVKSCDKKQSFSKKMSRGYNFLIKKINKFTRIQDNFIFKITLKKHKLKN